MNAVSMPVVQAVNGGMQGMPGQQPAMAIGSDAFAMLLQQLFGGENGEGAAVDGLMEMFGQIANNSEEEGTELASQMMAELMAGNGVFAELLQMQPQELTQQIVAAVQQNGGEQPQALQMLVNEIAAQDVKLDGKEFMRKLQAFQAQQPVVEQMQTAENAVQQIVQAEKGGEAQSQMQFYHAVAEVKKQFGTDEAAGDEPEFKLNFEQLQQDVNAGKFNPVNEAVRLKTAEQIEPKMLFEQVETGIKENLKLGKNEFQVKLKPEGLGEITVKLVENGDKIALSIVTSNAHVAKLLNSSLDELRVSLRDYNAEVGAVLDQQQYAQQQGYEHNFAQQHQQHLANQNHQHKASNGSWELGDEELLSTEAMQPAQLSTQLDAYI